MQVLYQTPLEIHHHEVWTEILSSVSTFQDITNPYISDALLCVLDTVLDFHIHEVWTEILSRVYFQDITNLYISDAFVCFGSVFCRSPRSWQCKVSFSLHVMARAIACKNFKANLESSHYVRERTVQVLHYFGSSTRWNAQVNDQND